MNMFTTVRIKLTSCHDVITSLSWTHSCEVFKLNENFINSSVYVTVRVSIRYLLLTQ